MLLIRRGETRDLTEVAAIQAGSPEASAWEVGSYLEHDFRVAADAGRIAGFLVARAVAPEERELLNLAVAPLDRRRGVARALVQAFLRDSPGAVFLEVRESNRGARNLYKSMGFHEVSLRRKYYENPPEAAIVMKFHSC
ncbi:MAG TPA: ribosomal protein S18-alanine N-acetyltransferase [Bryobacteraceae bacterium]|nr:ribosomal protein S18-alanine N-acetyltransferase [Bryobacteraceae bacterium]